MKYHDKKITLKNGKSALLRAAHPQDAAEIIELLKTASAQTNFLSRYPEEWKITVEAEETMLKNIENSDTSLMLCCELDGKIAGNCMLNLNSLIKTAHRASVAISVLESFWGLGIGTAMFEEMICVAKSKGVSQLELEFVEGNQRAARLYEKMGFVTVAEKPNAIRLKDGTMLKEYFMVKYL